MTTKVLVTSTCVSWVRGAAVATSTAMQVIEFDTKEDAEQAAARINAADGADGGPSAYSKFKPKDVEGMKVFALVL